MYLRMLGYAVICLLISACAAVHPVNSLQPLAQKLLGKSHAEILQCAGQPLGQASFEKGMVLRYYKEAAMFEESRPFLKGSQPGVHHGCWANVLIENDRVVGVEFRIVPEGAEQFGDECEEIFQACAPQ